MFHQRTIHPFAFTHILNIFIRSSLVVLYLEFLANRYYVVSLNLLWSDIIATLHYHKAVRRSGTIEIESPTPSLPFPSKFHIKLSETATILIYVKENSVLTRKI